MCSNEPAPAFKCDGSIDLELMVKRLEQKAESWKSAIKRIYPEKDAEVEYNKIKPFSREAEQLLDFVQKHKKQCPLHPTKESVLKCAQDDKLI